MYDLTHNTRYIVDYFACSIQAGIRFGKRVAIWTVFRGLINGIENTEVHFQTVSEMRVEKVNGKLKENSNWSCWKNVIKEKNQK